MYFNTEQQLFYTFIVDILEYYIPIYHETSISNPKDKGYQKRYHDSVNCICDITDNDNSLCGNSESTIQYPRLFEYILSTNI